MPRPKVSVVIPTYNCAPYLPEALNSVLGQGYEPIEVVVIDDGSTDDTLDVAARYGSRIKLLTQSNAGPAAARNRALQETSGEYVAFLDGDDLWLPGKLEAQTRFLAKRPEVRVLYTGFKAWRTDASGRFPCPMDFATTLPGDTIDEDGSGWIYHKLLFDSLIHIIAAVVHKSVFEEVGLFDDGLSTGSDYDFWIRVSRKFEIFKLANVYALYRIHPNSITHRPQAKNNHYALVTRALRTWGPIGPDGTAADLRALDSHLASVCFMYGYQHFWHGSRLTALNAFLQAARHRPGWRRNLTYLLLSLVPLPVATLLGRARSLQSTRRFNTSSSLHREFDGTTRTGSGRVSRSGEE
jgi:glycosyltransferase involved in cell wall biosynthesis